MTSRGGTLPRPCWWVSWSPSPVLLPLLLMLISLDAGIGGGVIGLGGENAAATKTCERIATPPLPHQVPNAAPRVLSVMND